MFLSLMAPAGVAEDAAPHELPRIDIFVDRTTAVMQNEERDPASIAAMEKLTRFMDRTGLNYRIQYVPWSRALRLVEHSDHALVFQILRTRDREKRFHWLLPIFKSDPLYLIGLAGTPEASLSYAEILKGNTLIGCQKSTAHCTVTREAGFKNERIQEIPIAVPTALEQMLLRKRVDFIIAYENVARTNLRLLGDDPDRVVLIAPVDYSDDYLAAPVAIQPRLLQVLQATSQEDLPLLSAD